MTAHLPIGLFDSGVGGLTIMKEIVNLLPHENIIYLADTLHLPYGEKSPDEIKRYTLENSAFLFKQKIKLLLIACHTASSCALKIIQTSLPIPVFGMIDAVLENLKREDAQKKLHIAILGTTGTIQSGTYQALVRQTCKNAKIFPLACPLFVPLIEQKTFDPDAFSKLAQHYLTPLQNESIDLALLACTHYPLVHNQIQNVLGKKTSLIDPSKQVALQTYEWLKNNHLLNPQLKDPLYQFYTTGDPDRFFELGSFFFSRGIRKAQKI
jgi:glutamate racemase